MEFGADAKTIIGLFIFILVGIVFFSPVVTFVNQIASPGSYTTNSAGSSTFVSNPYYAGPQGAIIASMIPIFYILVMIAVPALIVYRMTRER